MDAIDDGPIISQFLPNIEGEDEKTWQEQF
jgi:hypothetical protein